MDLFNFFGDANVSPLDSFGYLLLLLWTLFWKGVALWRASRGEQKYWFVALLVINTVSILELIYLFRFAKKRLTVDEVRGWVSDLSQSKGRKSKK